MNTASNLIRLFPTAVVGNGICMPSRTEQGPPLADRATDADARVSLLAEVDFKWLMAGQGWWIDPIRFHCEPSYASALIRFALASQSFALRASAALIQAQIDEPDARDPAGLAPEALLFGSPVIDVCQRAQA